MSDTAFKKLFARTKIEKAWQTWDEAEWAFQGRKYPSAVNRMYHLQREEEIEPGRARYGQVRVAHTVWKAAWRALERERTRAEAPALLLAERELERHRRKRCHRGKRRGHHQGFPLLLPIIRWEYPSTAGPALPGLPPLGGRGKPVEVITNLII